MSGESLKVGTEGTVADRRGGGAGRCGVGSGRGDGEGAVRGHDVPVSLPDPTGSEPTTVTASLAADPAAPANPVPAVPAPDHGAPTRRAVTLSVSMVATAGLLAGAGLLGLPYVVQGPGPTFDVLGEVDDHPLVEVEDPQPASGQLLLTTVNVAGSPTRHLVLGQVLAGWADPDRRVLPVEAVFSTDRTQEEIDSDNQAAMISSQEYATVAALEELGHEVPTTLSVAGTAAGTGADGVVLAGDVITTLQGQELVAFSDLSAALAGIAPGSEVTLGIVRDGAATSVTVVTGDDGRGGSLLGVFVDPEFHWPVRVSIQIENVGGPSAGMMFALGIVDRLSEADETNGAVIAGSGTIDLVGQVGPIGGITKKMIGAVRDGATWFLAPQANCDEVVGHVPAGLNVVAVDTLTEARAAVQAIGSDTATDLPTCA